MYAGKPRGLAHGKALGDQGNDHQTIVILKDHEFLVIDFINTSRENSL